MRQILVLLALVAVGCELPTMPKPRIRGTITVCVHNDSTAVYMPGVGWSPCNPDTIGVWQP